MAPSFAVLEWCGWTISRDHVFSNGIRLNLVRGTSHSTGANYLSAISGVLRYAVDLDLVPENPWMRCA